jgi:carboxylesterase type B
MILFILWLLIADGSLATNTVYLQQGGYIGKQHGKHVRYLGIRYAEKSHRFEPPIPISVRPGAPLVLKNATEWKAACHEFPNGKGGGGGITGYLMKPRAPQSEDCLFANIFVPGNPEEKPLPVLVFIYGGAFHAGSSSSLIYDPSSFIEYQLKEKFIFVSFDYRLGPLGYLIDDSPEQGINGNYGLMDQITALNWIFDNIKEFGGDPMRISVMGHSAGAISASWIYKLEERVLKFPVYSYITLSGVGSMWAERRVGGKFEQKQYQAVLQETGCAGIESLKRVPIRKLQKACRNLGLEYTWGPTIDNFLITDRFQNLPQPSRKAKLLITTVRDEGTLFIPRNFKGLAANFFSQSELEEILIFYGPSFNIETINAVLTDGIFTCPLYKFYKQSLPSSASIFLFNRPMAMAGLASSIAMGKDFGVFHGSDVLMLFGNQRELAISYPNIIHGLRKGFVEFITTGMVPNDWQLPIDPSEHNCDTLWNDTRPLIPKNYKSKLNL